MSSPADAPALPAGVRRPLVLDEVRVKCSLCPNIIVEHVSFTGQQSARARLLSQMLFGDPGGDGCADVCGACLAKVVLWCLDNRPDLIS